MNKIKTVAIIITMLFLCTNAYADAPSADEILKKVAATYKSMKTYKVKGDRHEFYNEKNKIPFTILFKEPNMYLISWSRKRMPPEKNKDYVSWSDGTQPYLYFSFVKVLNKMPSDEITLKQCSKTEGPTKMVPLLLSIFKGNEDPFAWLKDLKVEKSEKTGGEDCYVISGTSELTKREVMWVSKTSYLIRKYYWEFDRLKVIMHSTTFSNEVKKRMIEEYEKGILHDLFPEVEEYTEITSPELSKDDFNYAVPENATRSDWPVNY
ncbi:MAG: hypothetical protein GX654_13090 [Desulfatiglans sp.]|nr:hypothetical protein [Desulfatiglans sp.]